jgi:prevent-host-death family protein
MSVDVREATMRLSSLLDRLVLGEEIVITRAGRPIARLVPIVPDVDERHPGSARGNAWTGDDFDAPLPGEVANSFE